MADPIPDVSIGTPYGARGPYWSCNENSSGQGVHTGCDFPCPAGTQILAPIAGQIRHRSYGSAFGNHQFAISPDPGQPFAAGEVFFAHTRTRPADGVYVKVGDYLAEVGNEGNSSGPHLHMEHHADTKGSWSCSVHDDPQPVLDHDPGGTDMGDAYDYDYLGKPSGTQVVETGYETLDDSHWDPAHTGWEHTYVYLNIKPTNWKDSGTRIGMLRLRIVRDDGDSTGHHDFIISRDALDDDGRTLRHMLYWEAGDGKPTKVQVKCDGGLTRCELSTRYTKKAVVLP